MSSEANALRVQWNRGNVVLRSCTEKDKLVVQPETCTRGTIFTRAFEMTHNAGYGSTVNRENNKWMICGHSFGTTVSEGAEALRVRWNRRNVMSRSCTKEKELDISCSLFSYCSHLLGLGHPPPSAHGAETVTTVLPTIDRWLTEECSNFHLK